MQIRQYQQSEERETRGNSGRIFENRMRASCLTLTGGQNSEPLGYLRGNQFCIPLFLYDQMVQGENGLVVEMTVPEAVLVSPEGIARLMRDPAEYFLYAHIRQYQQSEGKGNEGEIQRVFRILEE